MRCEVVNKISPSLYVSFQDGVDASRSTDEFPGRVEPSVREEHIGGPRLVSTGPWHQRYLLVDLVSESF